MNAEAYQAILDRRSASAKFLVEPGPSAEERERILLAGSRAPDHGRLAPFRFVTIANREAFADVLERAARQEAPGQAETEIERAREKAFQGPWLVALIGRIDPAHPKITASDQWLSVGCALENIVLSIQALGYAAAIRSGRYLESDAVREAFRLGPDEWFTCFIAVGTATEMPPAKPKPLLAQISTVWTG